MKRMLTLTTVILLVLSVAFGAAAETPVRRMYDSVFNLLFDTNNVTLTGHAEFSLDGERFKTADAKYIQSGTRSLWDLKLQTPREDGTEREGGYTVIADGENVYVMEVFYPGVYKTGTTAESDTIVRRSVQLNLLRDLLRILSDQSEDLLGKDAVESYSDDAGLTVHIRTGRDVPEIVNTALNMTEQFVAKRYFDTDYDLVSNLYMGPMENYITVTQGILGSTWYISLNQADVTLKQDKSGNFESAEGKVTLELNTEDDGIRMLDISFRLDASDFGGSEVAAFNPDDYGVKPAKGNQEELKNTSPDPETEERLLAAAESRWARAGYTIDQTMSGSVIFENAGRSSGNERIRVDYLNEDLSVYRTYVTDPAGNLLELQNVTNNWQDMFEDWHFEEYPDQKLVKETEEELLGWLEDENPVLLSSGGLSLRSDWWYQNDDGLYLSFREGAEQVNHAWNEVYFVVRVAPEWRIEYFGCIGNG